MLGLTRRVWITLAALLILIPGEAPAQTAATSFVELGQVLKNGQTVVLTGADGRRTKGKVAGLSMSPPSIVLLTPDARTFAAGSVEVIQANDPVWTGALIGGGIGMGFALWDYLYDRSEPGNAAIFTVGIGLGTAVGMGIDALVDGRVLYRSRQTPSLTVAPLATNDRKGILVSVRF